MSSTGVQCLDLGDTSLLAKSCDGMIRSKQIERFNEGGSVDGKQRVRSAC